MLLHYLEKQATRKLYLFTLIVAACGFAYKHTKHVKISPVTAEPPFTVKTTDCVRQTGRMNGTEHPAVLPSRFTITKSARVGPCVKTGVYVLRDELHQVWNESQQTVLLRQLKAY